MSREIEFRGKCINSNEWVYGCFGTADEYGDNGGVEHMYRETCTRLHYIVSHDGKNSYIVYPHTVGQYVGINYKDGTKMFEDDIVKTKLCCGMGGDVEFITTVKRRIHDLGFEGWVLEQDYSYPVKLGNKHDNPELLEGDE